MREDWVECELGDITEINPKITNKNDIDPELEIQFLPMRLVEEISNKIHLHETRKFHEVQKKSYTYFSEGDVIFAKVTPCMENGKIAVANGLKNKIGYGSSEFHVFRSSTVVYNLFLFFFVVQESFRRDTQHEMTGAVGLRRVSENYLSHHRIPLAPLPEQRAIVAKIEELFSDLDKGIADLKKAQEQLKIYRQAVLKKAFEGELTKEWRAKQTNLPTAEELQKQIKEERQKHYEQQLEDWKKAVKEWEETGKEGKKPSRVSKPKIVAVVKDEDVENYDKIPQKWYWSRFGTVTYKIGDIDHKMPKTFPNGLPYLSTGNLKANGTIDFDNAKTISKKDFDRLALKIKPEKGDIIFPRYGTIGRNILIDIDRDFLVSYSCAIVKNITKLMDPKFALYYSISPVIKKEIKKYTVQTTQANIGIESIELFVFPLCTKA